MAFIFWFEQLLFSKVGITALVAEVVKPTLLKKVAQIKNKCHFIIPILKVSVTKFQGFFDLSNFISGLY